MAAEEPAYLTNVEVAQRYRVPLPTVRHWRRVNYGPAGVKVGTRVLYPIAEVRKFDQQLADAAGISA